jgi:hypothetical protein
VHSLFVSISNLSGALEIKDFLKDRVRLAVSRVVIRKRVYESCHLVLWIHTMQTCEAISHKHIYLFGVSTVVLECLSFSCRTLL